jgi:hypothetical protein
VAKKQVIFRSIYSSFCFPNMYAGWLQVGKQQVKKTTIRMNPHYLGKQDPDPDPH